MEFFSLIVIAQTPTPEETKAFVDLVNGIYGGWSQGGLYAALAAGAGGLVHLYRLDFVQQFLPSWAQWDNWKPLFRFLIVLLFAFVATLLTALGMGTPVGAAAIAAIGPAVAAALGAIAGRQVLKKTVPALAGMGINPKKSSLMPKLDLDRVP